MENEAPLTPSAALCRQYREEVQQIDHSMTDLLREAGVGWATICRIEGGEGEFRPVTRRKLQDALVRLKRRRAESQSMAS